MDTNVLLYSLEEQLRDKASLSQDYDDVFARDARVLEEVIQLLKNMTNDSMKKRHIPKRPVKIQEGDEGVVPKYECPWCQKEFTGKEIAAYCYHCGQALDWSEPVERNVKLSDIAPGGVFNDKYIVLEHFEDGKTAVLAKDLMGTEMNFGGNNNFGGSRVDAYLEDVYLPLIENEFPGGDVLWHSIDLCSLDGLGDYGIIERKVSLLTSAQYMKYRQLFKGNMAKPWWLLTPYSTPSGCDSDCVGCVTVEGSVDFYEKDYKRDLRPFFVLRSSTPVSMRQ